MTGVKVRPMLESDLGSVAALQTANSEAAQWRPSDYLAHEAYVAETSGRIVGFLVIQILPPDEAEVLNIAVDQDFKRQGIGRSLLKAASTGCPRTLHLEVRESNTVARSFYRNLDFVEIGRRRDYYRHPPEDAILMSRAI